MQVPSSHAGGHDFDRGLSLKSCRLVSGGSVRRIEESEYMTQKLQVANIGLGSA